MRDPIPITEAPSASPQAPYVPGSVEVAFALIEQAARMIAVVDPASTAARIREGLDASFYVDPTAAMRYLAQRKDMDRKLAILDDAARLLSHWTIEQESQHG